MPDSLAIAIKSGLFGVRNTEKTREGHIVRGGVAIGQTKNAMTSLAELNGKIGKSAKTAVEALNTFKNSSKPIEYLAKGVDLASNYVNPLICASAGLDVLVADDKEKAFVTNTVALGSMFGVEHLMKEHLDDAISYSKKFLLDKQGSSKVTSKIIELGQTKCKGKLGSIIYGIGFVVGSCSAYSVGDKFGNLLLVKSRS